ncbi:MAG: hemolysin-like protein [Rhodospirillaceae bacterium]|nr:hemolysin-like protein [Rhodospirillaceae bacterium]|tara:strand:+ start:1015 stop:1788 length:774 start_codon:yes stop_codon:yes gene_type:complete
MKVTSPDKRFEVRLAETKEDVLLAQKLRFSVFYEEMGATPNEEMIKYKKDFDKFDVYCDHMLVIDNKITSGNPVVGAYRMLLHKVAALNDGFYSSSEYDLNNLIKNMQGHNTCEIGRSCVHFDYRNNQTIQLLWKGLAHYYADNNLTRIFGCASFPGRDIHNIKLPLSYLYHYHMAPDHLMAKALDDRFISMSLMKKEDIDVRKAIKSIPPLIRAYLRLGGVCGDGAVIDYQFQTIDVFMILAMEDVPEKYREFFVR